MRRTPDTPQKREARLRFGARLRDRRVAAPVTTLRELAEACHVSRNTVSRWERGDCEVSQLHRDRLNEVLSGKASGGKPAAKATGQKAGGR